MKSNDSYQENKANFRQAKILVIDDNNDQWLLIQKAMQEVLPEVTVVWVSETTQALLLLEEWQTQEWEIPKMILLDLYMPENSDGWNLLQQIKRMPSPCDRIPIVMLSASINKTDIRTAYELGVSSYLIKPIDFQDWIAYFQELRTYWWETVTLPPLQYKL
ncbi:response regulator [Spirosoma endophyticum]|uniref:CheY chemotaxis protein or a CheY-like REC (Receiver) domain n=1 Tax=Spirosoma endophyticum TaxID=662367 RepID=A0A1I1MPX8_9BACT|nr:response regulator [Spirosoma endophyticum]SFC87527.1 CheY chemotaxis protein or a CheY-like REC (receiver) domain [Spirosoma endophyticum]